MSFRKVHALIPIALAALALAACGKKPAEEDATAQAEADEATELQARQEELNRREAEIAMKEKEQELQRRETALAEASKPKPAPKPAAAAPKPPAPAAAPPPAPAPKPVAAGPKNYVIPAGTSLSVQLPGEISTKTAQVGQRLSANLTEDLVVDGKVIAKAGTLAQGSITQVISGSKTIGGKPTLGITFDSLTFADGGDRPIDARITQVADKSDRGRDTAKIAGGAVAGGVIGHQIDSDQGKVIGAIIGAAAGTAAAKKTGKEVVLPAGTVVGMTLESPVTVTM
jgi:biotin carboxyl carrier protein